MLENLVFSLNATMPAFLMIVAGYILKKIRLFDEHSTAALNKAVFRLFLPALLIRDTAGQDFVSLWDGSYVLFCVISSAVSVLIAVLLSLTVKDRSERGEFIQAAYRSAAATLGIVYMTGVYDNVSMVALMILASVPVYNIVAVVVLAVTAPKLPAGKENSPLEGDPGNAPQGRYAGMFSRTVKEIVTNPIIIAIIVGLILSFSKLELPVILGKSLDYLANVASPLALIALGAAFEFSELKTKVAPIATIAFCKLFLFCMLFLPLAIYMGFRDDKLVAALIMLGGATTSSSYIMAKNMGHRGAISAGAVTLTTLLASFTLTLWLFILKSLGYI